MLSNTEAFLLLSRLNLSATISLKLVETLAFNAGLNGMIIGQAIDCYFEDQKLNLKELEIFTHTQNRQTHRGKFKNGLSNLRT